ncbi:hypothetical protein [Streptomyces flaveolus]|uniref:hypothetical protein n=1 Tax=Streptomyces flaveolus TaxID=67297 RepID=UPI0036BEC2F1
MASGPHSVGILVFDGMTSYESLRRAFARHLGLSPTRYRRRFATTTPAPGTRTTGG